MSCPVVSLKNGKVKGFATHLKGREGEKPVYVYRSIPFAKPPIGNLRFMPPQPAEPWTGVRDGTKLANRPMQSIIMINDINKMFAMKMPKDQTAKMDEDCLYLTVYTPEAAKGKNLAVMVFIYGGGFQMGDNIQYDATALAGMRDVVVVIPNYRVNMFGFFSLGKNSACPGNAGMLDQRMALEWVRDNIKDFGGDPRNVTIFGQSAGAGAVGYQLLSPMSRGLFHRAISQSGNSVMVGGFMSEKHLAHSNEKMFAHHKIEEKDEQKILEALQKIPAEDLMKAQEALMMEKVYYYSYIDGNFLTKSPEQAFDDGDFAKVPYMLGCNNSEGHGILAMALGPDPKAVTEEQAENAIYMEKNKHLMESWKKFYLSDDASDDLRFCKFYGDVISDGMFISSTLHASKLHSALVPNTFLYYATFQLKMFHDEQYRGILSPKYDWCQCDHGDEIQLVFGTGFTQGEFDSGSKFTEEEEELSRKLMTYFANFAKFGNPNKGDKVEVSWPQFGSNGEYLVVDHKFETRANLKPKMYKYWTKTVADLRKKYPEMD